jgi:prepilin-type N-terminal cleavage/methylation domain-containing protein
MRTIKNLRKMGGFTLAELILAIFIGSLLMAAVYSAMISGQKSSAAVVGKVAAQQDVRAALEIMAMEVSMASYNPTFPPGQIWMNPPAINPPCTGVSANQGWKGIQEATPTSITVEMDIGESGSMGDNDNEIIRYLYDPDKQDITRSTNCGTAQPFLGADPTAAVGTRTVTVINNTAGINNGANNTAIFRYYDSTGTELYPNTNPASLPNIRRVDITLAVQTEQVDPATNAYRQMIYSTTVLVRNHAIN